MVDLALASCFSPLSASDRKNCEFGRIGGRLRGGIVHNSVSVKENSQKSKFWINYFPSCKIHARGSEIRFSAYTPSAIWEGIGKNRIPSRFSISSGTCGRNILYAQCLEDIRIIRFPELARFVGFDAALVSLNPGTTVHKFTGRNRRPQCVRPRDSSHYCENASGFARLGAFGYRNYEMRFHRNGRSVRPDAGILDSRLNRGKHSDGEVLEDENYDPLDDLFSEKFKRNRNGKKYKLVVEDGESTNSYVTDSLMYDKPETSSMASDGKQRTLDSKIGFNGSQIDQKKEENPIRDSSLLAKDGPLLMDHDLLELRREMQNDHELERSECGELVGETMNDAQLDGRDSGNLVTPGRRPGRQTLRRSNILAKQVISIQSASSLGFVSQLWVDTRSWVVLVVELRPSLLSGEMERFLLKDVYQVGDVVLVQDESVMDNDLRLIGLETLVGYNVVTESRRTIGKVRGYTFDIDSGTIESLELDSFGISVIPASLVSTYCLFVEDVLEVASDTIVVEDGAASRLQRLSKGFWGDQKMKYDHDDYEDEFNTRSMPRQGSRRRSRSRRLLSRMQEREDWDLPMDY